MLALRWKHIDWAKFRIYVVSNFVRGKFGEPKSAASKKPVVLRSLVMGLLKNWQETTAYAGEEDFIFASDRLKGKGPRVPNMLGGSSSSCGETGDRDSTRSQVWLPQSQIRISFVPGRDRNRLQNHSGHAALGRSFHPAQGLRALAHGQANGGPSQEIEAMGLNEKTARGLIQ